MKAESRSKQAYGALRRLRRRCHIDPMWNITLRPRTPDEDSWGHVVIDSGHMAATIGLSPELLSLPDGRFQVELERVLLHELVHIVLQPIADYCYSLSAGDPAKHDETRIRIEAATCRLERALLASR